MTLKVCDRVRTEDGKRGEIILLTKDGLSAYVRLLDGAHARMPHSIASTS